MVQSYRKLFFFGKEELLEKEDVDFAMQNLTVDGHVIPYFRRGLKCNGFDDADAMANLAPRDSDDDAASQTNPSSKKAISKRPKSVATTTTSEKKETVSKNKNSIGDTVTIKTVTTTVTTIRTKRT